MDDLPDELWREIFTEATNGVFVFRLGCDPLESSRLKERLMDDYRDTQMTHVVAIRVVLTLWQVCRDWQRLVDLRSTVSTVDKYKFLRGFPPSYRLHVPFPGDTYIVPHLQPSYYRLLLLFYIKNVDYFIPGPYELVQHPPRWWLIHDERRHAMEQWKASVRIPGKEARKE